MSKRASLPYLFLYNGAKSEIKKVRARKSLNYLSSLKRNVTIKIPRFVNNLGHIPVRYLDLIELAGYIFCADRFTRRGEKDSLYLTSWSRNFLHVMKVRDYEFWSQGKTRSLLNSLLSFMTGDHHIFEFQPGHQTEKASMFDDEKCWSSSDQNSKVVMFSGGLDSTIGVLSLLESSDDSLVLASHISRPSLKKIIKNLTRELIEKYPGRVQSTFFDCNLHGERAAEETQRTRSFLYSAIGAAIASAHGNNKLYYFENGVVSINLPPSEQFLNARVSRTTHPRVLKEMSELISLIEEKDFQIENPFFWKTKTDILGLLKKYEATSLLHKTVSCSRTFDKGVDHLNKTHCGRCSQCIDRRFAVAASGLLEQEGSLPYAYDFVAENICSDKIPPENCEEKMTLIDFLRLSKKHRDENVDMFQDSWIEPITDLIDYVEGDSDLDKVEKLHDLFSRHGNQVFFDGLGGFVKHYQDKFFSSRPARNSLFQIIDKREYLDEPARLLSGRIVSILDKNLPIAFKTTKPSREIEVQDHVEALLSAHKESLNREFPYVAFSLGKAVPDFSLAFPCIYIEVKYLRGTTTPSKANAGIAEDCTKYPSDVFILFIVYDPEKKINDDDSFAKDFENKRPCLVRMIR